MDRLNQQRCWRAACNDLLIDSCESKELSRTLQISIKISYQFYTSMARGYLLLLCYRTSGICPFRLQRGLVECSSCWCTSVPLVSSPSQSLLSRPSIPPLCFSGLLLLVWNKSSSIFQRWWLLNRWIFSLILCICTPFLCDYH